MYYCLTPSRAIFFFFHGKHPERHCCNAYIHIVRPRGYTTPIRIRHRAGLKNTARNYSRYMCRSVSQRSNSRLFLIFLLFWFGPVSAAQSTVYTYFCRLNSPTGTPERFSLSLTFSLKEMEQQITPHGQSQSQAQAQACCTCGGNRTHCPNHCIRILHSTLSQLQPRTPQVQ